MSTSLPSSPLTGRKHYRNRAEWMLDQTKPPARMAAAGQLRLPQRVDPPNPSFKPKINDGVPDFVKEHDRMTAMMQRAHLDAEAKKTSPAEFKFRSLERSASVPNPEFDDGPETIVPLSHASHTLHSRGLPALSKRSAVPTKLDPSSMDWSVSHRWAESLRVYSGPSNTKPLLLSADDVSVADHLCVRAPVTPGRGLQNSGSIESRGMRKSSSFGSALSTLSRSGGPSTARSASHLESEPSDDSSDASDDEDTSRAAPTAPKASVDVVQQASMMLMREFGDADPADGDAS